MIILADTHSNYPLALRAIDAVGKTDQIIHLGDTLIDAGIIETALSRELIKVPGNCDADASMPRELVHLFDQQRFLITHGDRYLVKTGLGRLMQKAAEEHVQVVLYGHTHLPSITERDGILYVNPGSLKEATTTPTVALVTISQGKVTAEIIVING
jgi:putative phosphoesterase